MKYKLILYLSLGLSSFELMSQTEFQIQIKNLCSNETIGRSPGSLEEKNSRDVIKSFLLLNNNSLEQSFQFQNLNSETINAVNLVSFPLNKKADSTIIFIAHYDHLGVNSAKSKEILESKKALPHPGADDNASGVAMIIELGKWYASLENSKYKAILLFTSGHEEGLFGSENFVKSNNIDLMKIKAVYNFDMVGRLDKTSKTLSISDNRLLKESYDSISSNIKIVMEDLIDNTDLRYFQKYPIHLISVTTGIHDDYHRVSDTPEKINYEGMSEIFEFMKQVILKLA